MSPMCKFAKWAYVSGNSLFLTFTSPEPFQLPSKTPLLLSSSPRSCCRSSIQSSNPHRMRVVSYITIIISAQIFTFKKEYFGSWTRYPELMARERVGIRRRPRGRERIGAIFTAGNSADDWVHSNDQLLQTTHICFMSRYDAHWSIHCELFTIIDTQALLIKVSFWFSSLSVRASHGKTWLATRETMLMSGGKVKELSAAACVALSIAPQTLT